MTVKNLQQRLNFFDTITATHCTLLMLLIKFELLSLGLVVVCVVSYVDILQINFPLGTITLPLTTEAKDNTYNFIYVLDSV